MLEQSKEKLPSSVVPLENRYGPVLPHCRSIADAYSDVVLSMAYYGKQKDRVGNLDSHMDEVPEGTYEF